MTAEAATAIPKANKLRTVKPTPLPGPADAERPAVVLPLDSMSLAEQYSTAWFFRVPAGTTPEDLHLRSPAFSACAFRMSLGDPVTIATADDRLLMRGLCVSGNRGSGALVAITDVFEVPTLDEKDTAYPGYIVRRATQAELSTTGGHWVVVRESDGWLMNTGPLFGETDAIAFRNNHPAISGSTSKQLLVP